MGAARFLKRIYIYIYIDIDMSRLDCCCASARHLNGTQSSLSWIFVLVSFPSVSTWKKCLMEKHSINPLVGLISRNVSNYFRSLLYFIFSSFFAMSAAPSLTTRWQYTPWIWPRLPYRVCSSKLCVYFSFPIHLLWSEVTWAVWMFFIYIITGI